MDLSDLNEGSHCDRAQRPQNSLEKKYSTNHNNNTFHVRNLHQKISCTSELRG